tara:strand:- start:3155 stop:3844 length:690 start_codon:yes stop_codon:yes gene_type:complete
MPRNPYIRDASREQDLIESLTAETIRAMGRDVYYIPRTLNTQDHIFGEDAGASFDAAYLIEMYHEGATSFGGEGDIIGKFGIDVKDRASFRVAIKTFTDLVTKRNGDVCRPNEGDLIYYPLSGTLFEITFVEHESPLYQLGRLYSWVLFVETFAYNNEDFTTGVCEIDECFEGLRKSCDSPADPNEPKTCIQINPEMDGAEMGDNVDIEEEAEDIIDFSDIDPFSEGDY